MLDPSQPAVLITGSSKRIGKALALDFHRQGYSILIHYNHNETAANSLLEALNKERTNSAISLSCDLKDPVQISGLIEEVNTQTQNLSLLINNASIFQADLKDNALEQWNDTLNTNSRACFQLSQGLSGLLRKSSGTIINMIDIYAERPLRNHTIYSTSKAACEMLTKSLALELAPDIRVNGISPGAILWPENEQDELSQSALLKKVPLQKLGTTQAIVETANYLVRCDYITGQIIKVDGGRSINI